MPAVSSSPLTVFKFNFAPSSIWLVVEVSPDETVVGAAGDAQAAIRMAPNSRVKIDLLFTLFLQL
jgi:hypothetical protein